MKKLYIHEHEGIGFSKNGHRAYLRGEKPKFLWPKTERIWPTVPHHIEQRITTGRFVRKLIMFYRKGGPSILGGVNEDTKALTSALAETLECKKGQSSDLLPAKFSD